MHRYLVSNAIILSIWCCLTAQAYILYTSPIGFSVAVPNNYTLVATSGKSSLYNVSVEGYKDYPIALIDLYADTRFDLGYDYAFLLGERLTENYNNLLDSLFPKVVERDLLVEFLDWQWADWLSKQVPLEYMEEIAGIAAGGEARGLSELDQLITRVIVLANIPSDPNDLLFVLLDEASHDAHYYSANSERFHLALRLIEQLKQANFRGMQCSMFAAWGTRTANGQLFTGRNLDWARDTGINRNKLVTVYHPPEPGKHVHATVGFAGLMGALTGMSAAGLTVHEANLEEAKETFRGFPWILRLRYIMENAQNLSEAIALWETTNNTVGYNHMIGSAADASAGNHGAVVMETMAFYTAYFFDNDPREASAVYTYPNGTAVQIGFPLPQALYRTNNGFDPTTREYYLWSQAPSSDPEDSENRYKLIYEQFVMYQQGGVAVDTVQAVNITALVAMKGADVYKCFPANYRNGGANVLSVTYQPGSAVFYAAWETGESESAWTPAACSTYVQFDLNKFL